MSLLTSLLQKHQAESNALREQQAAELEDAIVQAEAIISAILGGVVTAAKRGASAKVSVSESTPVRDRGAKRTPEDLEKLTQRLHKYILKNPGQRIEQIGEGMEISTKELVLPIKKLFAGNALTSKGQKRATTYFSR